MEIVAIAICTIALLLLIYLVARQRKGLNEDFSKSQKQQLDELTVRMKLIAENQKLQMDNLEKAQNKLADTTEHRLEQMRLTVEEKLDKTLSERISKSFEAVGLQLNEVQKGLGEMHSLATDVGGLKRVLSNVKLRGGVGELQLKMLLEQFLAPGQYEANVHTSPGKREVVEFAIKFPGQNGEQVWLPIDSKLPQDKYQQLLQAYDNADKEEIDAAQKELYKAIKLNAKEIKEKYIDVPHTTKFGIMFLPFEGLYAEVARNNTLIMEVQRDYDVTIAGPTNLAAILTSFQVGFQTLAIQRRGDEVWKILGAVKKEFENFGDLLNAAQKKIKGGLNDLDSLVSTRTNAINRKLRDIQMLND